jgi:hypothetical protein
MNSRLRPSPRSYNFQARLGLHQRGVQRKQKPGLLTGAALSFHPHHPAGKLTHVGSFLAESAPPGSHFRWAGSYKVPGQRCHCGRSWRGMACNLQTALGSPKYRLKLRFRLEMLRHRSQPFIPHRCRCCGRVIFRHNRVSCSMPPVRSA